jgi:hypothetical protein
VDTAVVAMNTAPLATGEPVFRFYDNRQKYLLFVNTCFCNRLPPLRLLLVVHQVDFGFRRQV